MTIKYFNFKYTLEKIVALNYDLKIETRSG